MSAELDKLTAALQLHSAGARVYVNAFMYEGELLELAAVCGASIRTRLDTVAGELRVILEFERSVDGAQRARLISTPTSSTSTGGKHEVQRWLRPRGVEGAAARGVQGGDGAAAAHAGSRGLLAVA